MASKDDLSTEEKDEIPPILPESEERVWSSEIKIMAKKGVFCLLLVAYAVYFAFAMVMNFEKAIPLLCITVLVCFYVSCIFVKRKFGDRVAEILRCRKLNDISMFKSRKFSIIMYGGTSLILTVSMIFINLSSPTNLISLGGIFTLLLFSWLISYHKTKVDPRPVVWGLTLQVLLGLFVLRTSIGQETFSFLGKQVENFLSHVIAGVEFVFGENYKDFEFAFKLMPTVIYVNSVVSILYHFGIMQSVIKKMAVVMHYTMGTSAAETLCTTSSIFLGQPEASFTIRPYLEKMTLSELHAIMTAGFASVTADVFGLFVVYGISSAHILTAVLMSAPAGLAVSKIIYPEVDEPETRNLTKLEDDRSGAETANVIDAAAKGSAEAIYVVFAVVASLIAFLSILHFINAVISYLGSLVDIEGLTLDVLLSYILIPVAFLMGVPWSDCRVVGEVVGLKTIINEFVGYERLGTYIKANRISRRAETIATYALCGFSNPTTIGITLSGLGALIPSRRKDLAKLVMTSWIAGSIACLLTACFAGLMYMDEVENIRYTFESNVTLTTLSIVTLNVTTILPVT
ncbi:sodium/nucleoside cotransporter 2-like [Saccostrea echinata]|uniref:sodium/nucleoside cotransporter 2-like n=1 Tax=Saccostrea echinata TaxID=191078 RepID=UPI002A80AF06|nr:sodium/nucleoside cotransporter 2-like [Saccostrea echinata]